MPRNSKVKFTARRSGYTLVEVLVAGFLLGFLAVTLGHSLTSSTQTTSRSHNRSVAQMIARNQIENIKATGPHLVHTDTLTVNSTGEASPEGAYRVEVTLTSLCEGGQDLQDNSLETSSLDDICPDKKEVGRYNIKVFYNDRTQNIEDAFVAYELSVPQSGLYSETGVSP